MMIDLSSFDVIEYLQEAGISYSETGKNVSNNWIGIGCPFCGDSSNHCGIHLYSKVFSCFRCGEKGTITKLIMELENTQFHSAMNTVKKFTKKEKYGYRELGQKAIGSNAMVEQIITNTTEPLCPRDRDYLVSRGFNASSLSITYGLLSCKPTSLYAQRILIPFYIQRKQFTFTTRDVTDKANIKYIHCPINQSIAAPKELLYNIDNATKDTCVVVEGCFDVFRIGPGTIATSGTQYTRKQILLLSKFKRVFLLFDPEVEAQKIAMRFAQDLSFCSSSIEVIILKGTKDPGDMDESDVKQLRREIFGRIY